MILDLYPRLEFPARVPHVWYPRRSIPFPVSQFPVGFQPLDYLRVRRLKPRGVCWLGINVHRLHSVWVDPRIRLNHTHNLLTAPRRNERLTRGHRVVEYVLLGVLPRRLRLRVPRAIIGSTLHIVDWMNAKCLVRFVQGCSSIVLASTSKCFSLSPLLPSLAPVLSFAQSPLNISVYSGVWRETRRRRMLS